VAQEGRHALALELGDPAVARHPIAVEQAHGDRADADEILDRRDDRHAGAARSRVRRREQLERLAVDEVGGAGDPRHRPRQPSLQGRPVEDARP
jgi:hypothetical protein